LEKQTDYKLLETMLSSLNDPVVLIDKQKDFQGNLALKLLL
jgi:hypothetical protein